MFEKQQQQIALRKIEEKKAKDDAAKLQQAQEIQRLNGISDTVDQVLNNVRLNSPNSDSEIGDAFNPDSRLG